eukprot:364831-Chlamydomonas_euryale.AAC.11
MSEPSMRAKQDVRTVDACQAGCPKRRCVPSRMPSSMQRVCMPARMHACTYACQGDTCRAMRMQGRICAGQHPVYACMHARQHICHAMRIREGYVPDSMLCVHARMHACMHSSHAAHLPSKVHARKDTRQAALVLGKESCAVRAERPAARPASPPAGMSPIPSP